MNFTQNDSLLTAVNWVQSAVLGSVAQEIAVIAVASVGFMLLSGRMDVRRAVTVTFGCFLVFGAPSIAKGIWDAVGGSDGTVLASNFEPPAPATLAVSPGQPTYVDPDAGAAVPMTGQSWTGQPK